MLYWDISKALSYNTLFNFVVGNRGSGKTYGGKDWAIRDFIKTGSQFIYLRRYKQELKKLRTFFMDIAGAYPTHTFEVKGMTFWIDGQEAGYAIPLSTAKIEKSTAYPMVNKILFDEFVIDKGTYHYLADEVVNFLELYETVARMRDNVRVFFFSNAITISNPYFLYFKLDLPHKNTIVRKGDILLELVQESEFIEAKKKTRFGKLISGTEYADYSIENKFFRDDDKFITKKTEKAEHLFTFTYKDNDYAIWADYKVGRMFVSRDQDPYKMVKYTITLEDHTPNTMLIKRASKAVYIKMFIDNFKLGNVFYEDMKLRNVTYEIMRLLLT